MEPEDELLTPAAEEDSVEYDELEPASSDDEDYDSAPLEGDEVPPFDAASIDDEALMAELEKRTHLYQPPQQPGYPQAYGTPDPRLAQIVELSSTNPEMAEALRLQIAEERATARIMERIGPTLAPIAQREALQNSGLSEHGQQYLSETFAKMPGVDVAELFRNPLTRDVITRAARQYESERTARSAPRYESAASEAPTLSAEDWRAIRDFERMTGDRVDSDVIASARKRFS